MLRSPSRDAWKLPRFKRQLLPRLKRRNEAEMNDSTPAAEPQACPDCGCDVGRHGTMFGCLAMVGDEPSPKGVPRYKSCACPNQRGWLEEYFDKGGPK
jgi:hypothetical protein